MIRKYKKLWLRKSIIVVVSCLMAFGFLYMQKKGIKTIDLAGNVLGIQQIKKEKIDILCQVESGFIHIFYTGDHPSVAYISMIFVFDKEKVTLLNKNLSSYFDIDIKEKKSDSITVRLKNNGSLPNNRALLSVKFDGSNRDIVLGEAKIYFKDGGVQDMSIGVQ